MADLGVPLVYLDSMIYVNVAIREVDWERDGVLLWPDSLKLLLAAERGAVRLVASRLLPAEVVGARREDSEQVAAIGITERYLDRLSVLWVEVDALVDEQARDLARTYGLRGADAVHVATALRARCRYFVTREGRILDMPPRIGDCEITEPRPLWSQQTLDDQQVDVAAAQHRAQVQEELRHRRDRAVRRALARNAALHAVKDGNAREHTPVERPQRDPRQP